MLKLSLINPYSSDPFRVVKPLDLKAQGIDKAELKMALGSPMQLTLSYNTNLKDSWDFLNDDDSGVRLQTDDLDLAFTKFGENKSQEENGVTTSTFFDVTWKLKTSLPVIPLGQAYIGSFFNFIGSIDSDFLWKLIGEDVDIDMKRGILDNYQLLENACKQAKYTWRFNGLVASGNSLKPEILVGDFQKIEEYSDDPKYALQIASNSGINSNYRDFSPIINKIKGNPKSEVYTHCLAIGDSGGGASKSSIIRLGNPFATFIDDNFPLVLINGQYYIQNNQVSKSYQKFFIKSVSLGQSTSQNSNYTSFADKIFQDQKYIYNEALAEFRSKSLAGNYSFDIVHKKVFLVGNKIKVDYKESQKQMDGTTKVLFDIDQIQVIDNATFDLQNIQN